MKRTLSLLTLATLSACSWIPSLGPDYHEPVTKVPDKFEAVTTSSAGVGIGSSAIELSSWWTTFGDDTLTKLVEAAQHNNYDIATATSRVREARAQLGIADSAFLPEIDGAGGLSRTDRSNTLGRSAVAVGNVGITNIYSAGFDASWEFDIFGGLRREREAAVAGLEGAQASLGDVQVSLLAETARNYFIARSFEKRLEIARKNIQSQQESLDLVNARFQAGLVSELDVAQATTILEQSRAQVPSLQGQYNQTLNILTILTAKQLPEIKEILAAGHINAAGSKVGALPLALPVGLPSDLLRQRPDVRIAERQLAQATANVGVAVADWFPRFSLTGNWGWESSKSGSLFKADSRTWGIGPSFRWPLFAGGRIISNVRVQDERTQQALAQYQKAVLTAVSDAETVITSYEQERARWESLRKALDASNHALSLSQELYREGVTDFQRVLDAQRNTFLSEEDLAVSEQNALTGVVAIYKALGGGWKV